MAGFRKAKPEQAALKMGFYGLPGSGKTFTALLCAEGIAKLSGRRVAFVDTERGTDFYTQAVKERRVHPAAFDVDALYTRSLTEVLSSVRGLSPKEHGVIVIDSMTHLWEAARNAYTGRTNRVGAIPFHAWAQIKKPYKELMEFLISSPFHVIICGRQGNDFEEDEETGETKKVGVKMKAEGETPYEPHILMRMEAVRDKEGNAVSTAFAEKDRTGILAGRVITNPDFEKLIKPLLSLLGEKQAVIPTGDETALVDAEALEAQEREKAAGSAEKLRELSAKLDLAKSADEVKALGKEITADVKKQMTSADVATLRERYLAAEERVKA